MVNVSHTHFAPRLGGDRNLEYEALFTERTQPLLSNAVADLQPAVLDFTIGSCTMGANRRQLDDQGRVTRGLRRSPASRSIRTFQSCACSTPKAALGR